MPHLFLFLNLEDHAFRGSEFRSKNPSQASQMYMIKTDNGRSAPLHPDQKHLCYREDFTLAATSAVTQLVQMSSCAVKNSKAASGPSAWLSSI